MLMERDEVVERMRAWRFYFDKKPVQIEGVKFDAGNVIMGKPNNELTDFGPKSESVGNLTSQFERLSFSIENSGKELGLSLTKN